RRRLHPADVAAPAVADARFGDLAVADGVGAGDVLGPDDAGAGQLAHLAVGAHLLPTLDDQVAVGHDGGDDSGHRQVDPLRAVDAARAVGVHGAFGADHVGGVETAGEGAAQAVLQPEEVGHPARGAVGAIALGRVLGQIGRAHV